VAGTAPIVVGPLLIPALGGLGLASIAIVRFTVRSLQTRAV
jgi:hypothetical protein